MEGTTMKWLGHNCRLSVFGAAILALAAGAGAADAAVSLRLKDLARIKEVRSNQLYGIGLVGGLNGTGDSEMLADQLVTNMLQRLHVAMVSTNVTSKNVAAVIVTAEAPPFIMEGTKFDVTVSCLGSAASLAGGILLQTPLQGADGQVYATAQGPLLIGGFAASKRPAFCSMPPRTPRADWEARARCRAPERNRSAPPRDFPAWPASAEGPSPQHPAPANPACFAPNATASSASP